MTGAVSTPSGPTALRRQRMAGLDMAVLERPNLRELHLTIRPLPREMPCAMFRRLEAVLKEHDAAIVRQEIFGTTEACGEGLQCLKSILGDLTWPVIWIEGGPCADGPVAGLHVLAIAGTAVETLSLDHRPVGRLFNDGLARHCVLGDLRPSNLTRAKPDQTKEVYAKLETALARAGMNFGHVMRTWFFLDDLLAWYDDFNVVRNAFFKSQKPKLLYLPASTGIAGKNRAGAALVLGAWAVEPLSKAVSVREVYSPLQCPAPSYGSGFSRAVEMAAPDHRRLLVSGTASINPDGTSARPDDAAGQIELTMEVVQAILESRKLSFADVTRATGYLKRAEDAPVLAKWCANAGCGHLPLVVTESAICRDELLFEIELDALTTSRLKA